MLTSDVLQTPGLQAEVDLIRSFCERLPNKNKVGCFMLFIVKIVFLLMQNAVLYLLCYYLLFFFEILKPKACFLMKVFVILLIHTN